MSMKRVIITLVAVIVITIIIPLVIVEFVTPVNNAASTAPKPSPSAEAGV